MFGLTGCGEPSAPQQSPDLAGFVVAEGPPEKVFVCVASCTTNTECQDSCAAPSSGTSCCDSTTHQCYTAQTMMCPAPPDLGVVSPY